MATWEQSDQLKQQKKQWETTNLSKGGVADKITAFAAFSQQKEVPLENTRRTNPALKKRLEAERKKREEQERLKAEEKKRKEEAANRAKLLQEEKEKLALEELKSEEKARQLEIERLEREIEEMAAIRIQSLVRSGLTRVRLKIIVDQMIEDLLNPEAAEARKIQEAASAAPAAPAAQTNEMKISLGKEDSGSKTNAASIEEQKKQNKGCFGKLFAGCMSADSALEGPDKKVIETKDGQALEESKEEKESPRVQDQAFEETPSEKPEKGLAIAAAAAAPLEAPDSVMQTDDEEESVAIVAATGEEPVIAAATGEEKEVVADEEAAEALANPLGELEELFAQAGVAKDPEGIVAESGEDLVIIDDYDDVVFEDKVEEVVSTEVEVPVVVSTEEEAPVLEQVIEEDKATVELEPTVEDEASKDVPPGAVAATTAAVAVTATTTSTKRVQAKKGQERPQKKAKKGLLACLLCIGKDDGDDDQPEKPKKKGKAATPISGRVDEEEEDLDEKNRSYLRTRLHVLIDVKKRYDELPKLEVEASPEAETPAPEAPAEVEASPGTEIRKNPFKEDETTEAAPKEASIEDGIRKNPFKEDDEKKISALSASILNEVKTAPPRKVWVPPGQKAPVALVGLAGELPKGDDVKSFLTSVKKPWETSETT